MRTRTNGFAVAAAIAVALMLSGARAARAHCDTMSGPVINAARAALASGNVNHALIWVQPGDEAQVRADFDKARAARKAGGKAQKAAELRFFETLVRVHRKGEGAPYTGLKPAGTDVGPAVAAADTALAAGSAAKVRGVLTKAVQSGIDRRFHEVASRKNHAPDDVAAGRAYVKAYVDYTHFAEKVYDQASATGGHHEHAASAAAASAHGQPAAAAHGCKAPGHAKKVDHAAHASQAKAAGHAAHGH